MKTFFKSFFKFLQSIFLQVILSVVAFASFEECELIGRFNGIEYFKNSNDEIITINPQNYGEIVGKKGDKLWEKIYQEQLRPHIKEGSSKVD